ncbi:hypothetical protein ACNHYB_03765 [Isoptericola jiangsuensis]|uniref:hypothetical protein n=1 Tax=Isoptericola jiangsuensis TaxID=548579 RepID=UPI003AAF8005
MRTPPLSDLPAVLELRGPVGEFVIEDRTVQIGPEWHPDNYWTTVWNPDFYIGDPADPPYPSVKVWLDIPKGESARVDVGHEAPPGVHWRLVLESVLYVYDGIYAAMGQRTGPYDPEAPRLCVEVALQSGDYPIQVWVDAATREAVRAITIVLGDVIGAAAQDG